jgi:hypothetical protein
MTNNTDYVALHCVIFSSRNVHIEPLINIALYSSRGFLLSEPDYARTRYFAERTIVQCLQKLYIVMFRFSARSILYVILSLSAARSVSKMILLYVKRSQQTWKCRTVCLL